MKKIFLKVLLFVFLFSISLYGASPQDITLEKGETKEYEVKAVNNETNPAVYAKDLILKEGATLKVNGNIDNVNKTIVGIFVKRQGFKGGNLEIQKGAKLEVNVEVQNYTLSSKKIPLEGVRTFSLNSSNKLKIDEGATLTVKAHSNKALIPEDNHNSHSHDDEDDLFHQMWHRGIGINLGTSLEVKGNLNVESTGTGIKNYKEPSDERSLVFDKGSKTFIKAGLIGIDANTEKQRVIFKEGSYSQIIGGAYGLISKNATFEKGSKVKAMGKYGLGNFKYSGTGDKYTFQAGSEIEILANQAALYAINIKEGSTKLIAKARNVFMQVDTRVNGNENNLATLTLEKGSILEGNIDKSWKAKILMEKGTKIFSDDRIDTNLDLRGELFVGPREAYENIKSKNYKEEIEKMDSVAGASVILMGKLKNQSLKSLNAKTPYENLPTDKYYTVRFNDYTYNNKIKVNFDNSKIHLRIGGADKTGATNDKIFFSRNTTINGKGELVFHKRNSSQVTKNTVFKILEEEGLKNINGIQGYYLEKLPLKIPDVSFGQLVFTTKVQKLNGRYVVSLVFKGIEADNFLLAKGETKTLNKKKEGSLEDAILSAKEVTIEEKSTLNIKGDTNGLFAKNKVTVEEKANLNIETENKIALKLGENLETFGNINIKNARTGILADNTTSVLKFENGSKTIVNAKDVAVNAQKGTSEFKGGSNVELTSNKYALVAKKAVFEKGSTVKLNGEYGIGTLSETDSSDVTFNSQSEVNINSSNSGIYNVNVGGSGKLSIKAPNVLKQVRTVNQSLKFESGSVLEGNIEKSWNANLILDKGSKMFVNNKIEANMDIKGDLFVGTRNSYEKEESKNSMQTLSTMSTFSSSDKYNTVHYNKDSNGHKTKVNLDNANIHLRINGEQSESNDKIVFSKDTEITGKGEITLHPENVSKVKRNMTYSLLEEEGKDVGGNKVYNLEKTSLTLKTVEFGPLVYGRKDKKVNGKYIVTLEDTGELSQAAKNTLTNSRDSYKYNQEELKAISDKIFENHNLELKNNFWLLVSKENLKNKDSVIKLNQNTKYAGYDHTFNTGISLGFFAGQSTGRYKNIGQGIYLKKDLKPFYLGTVYKHTKSKDKNNDKKLHSNDFSFVVGYNKDISEKTFLDSNIKLTRGYISDYKYTAENDLNTRNEKTNYWNGEINTKLGYKFKYGDAFLKAGLDKDLKGNQKVIWNENIDEEIKYDDLSKNIGIGMEYKIKQHSFNIELSRKYSKHYRANTKISFGYSYKF